MPLPTTPDVLFWCAYQEKLLIESEPSAARLLRINPAEEVAWSSHLQLWADYRWPQWQSWQEVELAGKPALDLKTSNTSFFFQEFLCPCLSIILILLHTLYYCSLYFL